MRNVREVVTGRRRSCRPLQRPSPPWVRTCDYAASIALDRIHYQQEQADRDQESAARGQQIQPVPTQSGGVRVYAAWHPCEPQVMHGKEGHVEANEQQPETELP